MLKSIRWLVPPTIYQPIMQNVYTLQVYCYHKQQKQTYTAPHYIHLVSTLSLLKACPRSPGALASILISTSLWLTVKLCVRIGACWSGSPWCTRRVLSYDGLTMEMGLDRLPSSSTCGQGQKRVPGERRERESHAEAGYISSGGVIQRRDSQTKYSQWKL